VILVPSVKMVRSISVLAAQVAERRTPHPFSVKSDKDTWHMSLVLLTEVRHVVANTPNPYRDSQ
jgi:hypothetical protein